MIALAVILGFVGPFGTYQNDPFFYRVIVWCSLLIGAYVLVRPLLFSLDRLAVLTALPSRALRFWGAVLASAPLAILWSALAQDTSRTQNGQLLLVSFALFCGLAVFAVLEWANWVESRVTVRPRRQDGEVTPSVEDRPPDTNPEDKAGDDASRPPDPPLLARLSPAFRRPIVALHSEDHYVRVHGAYGSELLLMRLRDAIAEMGDVRGERVHRSWWVAQEGVLGFEQSGRSWVLHIVGGARAQVARDSVNRLKVSGFLSAAPSGVLGVKGKEAVLPAEGLRDSGGREKVRS